MRFRGYYHNIEVWNQMLGKKTLTRCQIQELISYFVKRAFSNLYFAIDRNQVSQSYLLNESIYHRD